MLPEVEHQRNAQQPADGQPKQRSLVQMAMDDIGPPAQCGSQHLPEQKKVKGDLVG